MMDLMIKGGWLLLPIGIACLLATGVTLERLFHLRLPRLMSESTRDQLRHLLVERDFDGALTVARRENLLFNRLVETLVRYRQLPQDELRQLLEDQSRQEVRLLERNLTVLKTIATIAPLLGLLGTVTGMIKVFTTLSLVGVSQAPELSGGIAEALITTAAGLSVAIPTIIVYYFFENKVDGLLVRLEKALLELHLLMRSDHAQ
jgi:biopolymer transport protein ExbB